MQLVERLSWMCPDREPVLFQACRSFFRLSRRVRRGLCLSIVTVVWKDTRCHVDPRTGCGGAPDPSPPRQELSHRISLRFSETKLYMKEERCAEFYVNCIIKLCVCDVILPTWVEYPT